MEVSIVILGQNCGRGQFQEGGRDLVGPKCPLGKTDEWENSLNPGLHNTVGQDPQGLTEKHSGGREEIRGLSCSERK